MTLRPDPVVAPGTTRLIESYGPGPRQFGEWWAPPSAGTLPTVVLVHGGFWRPGYDLSLEDALAADLAGRGYLIWNIEYGAAGELWPATFTDAAAAYDHLAHGQHASRVDPARIAVVGHSAGGQVALWLASRGAALSPALAVGQAPVAALARAADQQLGQGAVTTLLRGLPAEVPEHYAYADPMAQLPCAVRTVLIHGVDDDQVPLDQSETYAAAAGCTLQRVPGGHYEHLDPTSQACQVLRDTLASL